MRVNGVDLAVYEARFWGITPAKRTVTNGSEMLEGVFSPLMLNANFGLSEYTLQIRVRGADRCATWENASEVLRLFSEVAEVEIEGFADRKNARYFRLTLTGVGHEEYGARKDRWHMLTLQCKGYEHGERQEYVWQSGGGEYEEVCEFSVGETGWATKGLPASRTSVPVPMTLEVEQIAVCGEGDKWCPGGAGKPYPMEANIKIAGTCRDRKGKEAGDVWMEVRASLSDRVMGVALPDESGWGICRVKVDGGTGRTELSYNGERPERVPNTEPAFVISQMPGVWMWGYRGQTVRVRIDTPRADIFRPQYRVRLTHTPVYL